MNNTTCPHCGLRAIPLWRKALTSEFFPARCNQCRKCVTVSRTWALVATIPVVLTLWLANLFPALNGWPTFLVGLAGLFGFFALIFVIPLQKG